MCGYGNHKSTVLLNGLRRYGDYKQQIGLEKTFGEYLKKILDITAEIKRVLKKSGQFWLNLGDCYGGNMGWTTEYANKKQWHNNEPMKRFGGNIKTSTLSNPESLLNKGRAGNQKCLAMMPERLAIKMIDEQGWILRNKIKWAKQVLLKKEGITKGSVMPTSVKDRFNESGEELYFFVKNKKYYSDLDAVRLPPQTFENRPDGIIREREFGYNTQYPEARNPQSFNYRVRDAKRKAGQPQFKASEEEIKNYNKKTLEMRMVDTKNKDQKSSRTYNIKKLLSEVRLGIKPNTGIEKKTQYIESVGRWGKQTRLKGEKGFRPTENLSNVLGKNLPTIWLIGSEPHNFQRETSIDTDHFASFPQALLEIPIQFGCPSNGLILDPFMGSGTTAIVAKKLGRNYIGIELNKEYCKIAEKRLDAIPESLFK